MKPKNFTKSHCNCPAWTNRFNLSCQLHLYLSDFLPHHALFVLVLRVCAIQAHAHYLYLSQY